MSRTQDGRQFFLESAKAMRIPRSPLLLVLLLCATAAAQGPHWDAGPPLTTARAGCGVAIDASCRLWATGGRITWSPGANGSATDTIECLDLGAAAAQWTPLPQHMLLAREFHAAICVGDYLYVIGGSNSLPTGTVFHTGAERLRLSDPSDGWQPLAPMPTARNAMACASDDAGRIYVVGGLFGNTNLADVERYDPATGVWEILPSLHQVRSRPGVARDARGRIYAIGGGIDGGQVVSVERFDPAHPQLGWQFAAPLPSTPALSQSVSTATAADGRIYAVRSAPGSNPCMRYDPLLDQWEALVPFPINVFVEGNSTAFDCVGRLWAVGEYPSPTPVAATYSLNGLPVPLDSDGDGLLDSTEIEMAMGTGCPNPFNADSDGDGVQDGPEVAAGTNPCNPDTDDDGIPDGIDPLPTVPGVTTGFLEDFIRGLGEAIAALPVTAFNGPNANANSGRRNALRNRTADAANAVHAGNPAAAIEALTSLLEKIDGELQPQEWLVDSPDRQLLAAHAQMALSLLNYRP